MKFSFDSEVLAYKAVFAHAETKFPSVMACNVAGDIFQAFLLLPNLLGEKACALIDLVEVRLSAIEPPAQQPYHMKTSFKIIITAGETNAKIDIGFEVLTNQSAHKNAATLAQFVARRIQSHVEMYTGQESEALKNLYDLFHETL